jgi:hypothetical protein
MRPLPHPGPFNLREPGLTGPNPKTWVRAVIEVLPAYAPGPGTSDHDPLVEYMQQDDRDNA